MNRCLIGLFLIGATAFGECNYKDEMNKMNSVTDEVIKEIYIRTAKKDWSNLDALIKKSEDNSELTIHLIEHKECENETAKAILSFKETLDKTTERLYKMQKMDSDK
ncbi:MAG: hypothetical protein ACRC0F_05655 [Cetobacterium sp.]